MFTVKKGERLKQKPISLSNIFFFLKLFDNSILYTQTNSRLYKLEPDSKLLIIELSWDILSTSI